MGYQGIDRQTLTEVSRFVDPIRDYVIHKCKWEKYFLKNYPKASLGQTIAGSGIDRKALQAIHSIKDINVRFFLLSKLKWIKYYWFNYPSIDYKVLKELNQFSRVMRYYLIQKCDWKMCFSLNYPNTKLHPIPFCSGQDRQAVLAVSKIKDPTVRIFLLSKLK